MRSEFRPHIRIVFLGCLICLGFSVLVVRLFTIQILKGKRYHQASTEQSQDSVPLLAERGNIYDRNLRPLALTYNATSVAVRPRAVRDVRHVESRLMMIDGVDPSDVRLKTRSNKAFEWIVRGAHIDDATLASLRSVKGIELLQEAARVYPLGNQGAAVIGATHVDNRGASGLEFSFDEFLAGTPGEKPILRTATNQELPDPEREILPPVPGRHVVSTLDADLQAIVEFELAKGVETFGAKRGVAILARPETGEILALAELPGPSRASTAGVDSWTLHSVSGMYEPGSTFKLLAAACLLEEHLVDPQQLFFGENGTADFGSYVVRDPHPYAWLTFRDAFLKSSNICMAKASEVLLEKDFYRFLREFGFGTETGINLSGESPGSLHHYEKWSGRTCATLSFGYEIGVTPLQMVAAYGALANDGYWVAPKIVSAIVDGEGRIVRDYSRTPKRRVLSEETAAILQDFCRGVVEEGTGTNASVEGLEVCGKTGTARKLGDDGQYSNRHHIASFIGFVPRDRPQIVGMVLYDEPGYKYRWGGSSAARTFARIVRAVGSASDVFAWGSESIAATAVPRPSRIPNFLGLEPGEAHDLARNAGYRLETEGSGSFVLEQTPAPGVACVAPPVIRLLIPPTEIEPSSEDAVRIPVLTGLSAREAKRRLAGQGLAMALQGSGFVVSQEPRAGSRVKPGTTVRVRCSPQADRARKSSEAGAIGRTS